MVFSTARGRKRILVAVTGLSPQIVTETLYALACKQQPAWVPDEIHVITTREGANRIKLALFTKNWFQKMIDDYDLGVVGFDETCIHTVKNASGKILDDIRTPEDNENVADAICEMIREFTAEEDTELHVSIAGGRKTMGYYLGYALSLFGRPQDKLSHVLVSEPFESSWQFFYPTPYSQVIETHDKSLADSQQAEITLAEIPFVRLREELPNRMLRIQEGKASFSETVVAAQKAYEQPHLFIDLTEKYVVASGEVIEMKPADLAFYAMFARSRKTGMHPQYHGSDGLAQRYLREYERILGSKYHGDYEKAEIALDCDDIKGWFESRKSRTNAAIRRALGQSLARCYEIASTGRRKKTRYVLNIPMEAIEFSSESHERKGEHKGLKGI